MLCKNCGLRPTTTHIKRIVNGRAEEYHLCSECAKKLNISAYDPFDLSDLWGSFFGDRLPGVAENQKQCKSCGATFAEIARKGKLGCPDCYDEFYNELLPSLRKMHGKTRHVGKVPNCADNETKASYMLTDLKKKLDEAVESENYELAAKLRDEIKSIESMNEKKDGEGNE